MKKSLRTGKVLVDWSQNDEHKTTVNVYSLRARERPTVSTPLRWEEVEAVLESGDPEELAFTSDAVLARVAEHGDLFRPVIELEQELPGSFLRVLNIRTTYLRKSSFGVLTKGSRDARGSPRSEDRVA